MDGVMVVVIGDILATHGVILDIGDLDGDTLDTGEVVTDIVITTTPITTEEEDLQLTMVEEITHITEITLQEDTPTETIQTEVIPIEAIQTEAIQTEAIPLTEIATTQTDKAAILITEEVLL
jgi:hypothetical protein